MDRPTGRHAIIIGGGASGVLLAHQLLARTDSDFHVTLIEKQAEIGRGLAYLTRNPEHLLNVRVANMSALPDDPDHFWRWLCARGEKQPLCPDPYCFVPRHIYGDYLASLIEPLMSPSGSRRFTLVQGECVEISEQPASVRIALADGTRHGADVAILATGHDTTPPSLARQTASGTRPSAGGIDRDAAALILGTGLTMVDHVLSLLLDGHRGPIVAMSRRGLLARAHRRVDPLQIVDTDIPFGASIVGLSRWFRHRIAMHIATGGDWRSVMDALRPHAQRLWQELPPGSKRRFLEHARAWWDVHRHRMAPEVEARILQALAAGRLTVMAAKLAAIEPNANGALVRYRRRGSREIVSMQVGTIVDCTGIVRDPRLSANPALRSLFDQGLARADPLHIGIEIGPNCAIVDRNGSPSRRLFAVGPLTRAAFWEIIAIPDIRNQCAKLATQLVHRREAMPN